MKREKVLINLNEEMKKLVEKNVKHYKSDLDIDFKQLESDYVEKKCRKFYWICRECGSNLIDLNTVNAKGSFSNTEIKYYVSDKTAKIFYIEVESLSREKGELKITGTISKKVYKSVYKSILEKEFEPSKVEVKYSYLKKDETITETKVFENNNNVFYQILSLLRIEREDLVKYNPILYIK